MEKFELAFGNSKLKGNIIGKKKSNILFLHGGGNTNISSFDIFRTRLISDSVSSIAFDCIGHGETGGILQSSSLFSRTEQATEVINSLPVAKPLVLIGRSMGGDTALRLIELYSVSTLILLVPGVYSERAYKVNFGGAFTSIIRQEKNWENSNVWNILKKFNGKLLVISAEHDEVIPEEIPRRIFDTAGSALKKDFYIIPQTGHNITKYLTENKKEFDVVYQKIYETITEN